MQDKAENSYFDLSIKSLIFINEFQGERRLIDANVLFQILKNEFLIKQYVSDLEKLPVIGNFFNVHKVSKLFTTIPVTTCSCGRLNTEKPNEDLII